jgi:tmRNA-binding protein
MTLPSGRANRRRVSEAKRIAQSAEPAACEAGLVLAGNEVKSLRAGNGGVTDAPR